MSENKIKHKPFNNLLNIVVAYTFNKQGIGKNGELPWKIAEDMAHFKHITTSKEINEFNIVVMGRKTWESIPNSYRPLENRFNIILSNNEKYKLEQNLNYKCGSINKNNNTAVYFTTWDKFINTDYLQVEDNFNKLYCNNESHIINKFNYYIIGGEQIYKQALSTKLNIKIHVTEIYPINKKEIECDTFFPNILNLTKDKDINNTDANNTLITKVSQFHTSKNKDIDGNNYLYRFITYNIQNDYRLDDFPFKSEEDNYLNLMNTILYSGASSDDRTGIGTLSIFGSMLKYNLRDTFPLCTTKKMFFRAIFEELMFYLSGKTDNKILQDKNIHVWDGNTTREFLDKRGLQHYEEGDLGQTYGFNFRHFGAEYKGCNYDYGVGTNKTVGYDQLANVIHLIKNEPGSRRIIIDLWDCTSIHKAALPSCLCKYQFNVNTQKKELNLAIYLRSSDFFLANNWNSTCGALFVHLLCNLEGITLTPGDLTVFIADAHLYKTHQEQVKLNLTRTPLPFPKLLIKGDKKKDINEFEFEDLDLIGYKAYSNIKAEMAI